MEMKAFPVIDPIATGNNIRRLRLERGLTVRDLQSYFGFEEPRAIYKWQKGETLPTVDNLYALGSLLETPMDQILVSAAAGLRKNNEQQSGNCCSNFFRDYYGISDVRATETLYRTNGRGYGRIQKNRSPLILHIRTAA